MAQFDKPLQPNNAAYESTGDATSPQSTQNAAAARAAEASINNALGAGWGPVGGSAQARANPKGVGRIPSGATGQRPRPIK